MEKRKELSPILFLADDKKSKTGDPTEDEYEIMIPDGFSDKIPYGKIIRMFTEEVAQNSKPLGVGLGVNFKQAVILGDQHCSEFWVRVVGYRYMKNSPQAEVMSKATKEKYIAVQFYESF